MNEATNGGGKTSAKLTRPVVRNASGVMKKLAYKGRVQANEVDILAQMMKSFGINELSKKPKSKTVKNEKVQEDVVHPSKREPISSTKSKRQRDVGVDTKSKRQKKEVVKNEKIQKDDVRPSERLLLKQNEPILTISSTKSKRQSKEVGIDTAAKKQKKTVVKNTDYYEDIMLSNNPHVSIEERIAAGEALKAMREEEFSKKVQVAEKEMERIGSNEALKAKREEEFSEMVEAAELEMMRIDIELNGLKYKMMAGGKKKCVAKK